MRPNRLSEPIRLLLRDETTSGKLIIIAVAAALVCANTPLSAWYGQLLQANFGVAIGTWNLSLDLSHWVSEGLMAFFFLAVGLELKRELTSGELKNRRTAILPFAAAVGGMLLPALFFVLLNTGQPTLSGWAIPTATDIALAVGVLAILGRKVPSSIRVFMLALATVDDILAVAIITVFYNASLNFMVVGAIAVINMLIYLCGRLWRTPIWLIVIAGIALWLLALHSGIHPSIIGVLLGFALPTSSSDKSIQYSTERVERLVVPLSALVAVPLFAFVSAGISLDLSALTLGTSISLGGGIVAGLVLGKMLGIFGAVWLMVKTGLSSLPDRASWLHILGIGSLAGIGFTVSIFVTELAFSTNDLLTTAKLSIIIASIISALSGLLILRKAHTNNRSI